MTDTTPDADKIDEAVLALLYLIPPILSLDLWYPWVGAERFAAAALGG
jgi:hypothetical protein